MSQKYTPGWFFFNNYNCLIVDAQVIHAEVWKTIAWWVHFSFLLQRSHIETLCVCLYMDAPAGNEWWCTVHACRYTYLQTSAYGSRRRGRLGRLLWNLFGYIFFILVAIGFTGQNGMWPNERYFDPSSELTVLLEELCMAQDIFYKVVRNPPAAFAKS